MNRYSFSTVVVAATIALVLVLGAVAFVKIDAAMARAMETRPLRHGMPRRRARSGARVYCRFCSCWDDAGDDCATFGGSSGGYPAATGSLKVMLRDAVSALRRVVATGDTTRAVIELEYLDAVNHYDPTV